MPNAARILLVDDLEDVRESTTAVLEAAGYVVAGAANGEQALALLGNDPAFDLLMTDIALASPPNGFELAQRAVQLEPSLKVLYTTGYTWNLEDVHTSVPGSRLLRKPYRAHQLLREIDLLVDSPAPVIAAPDRKAATAALRRRPNTGKPALLVVEDDSRSSAVAVELFMGLGLVVFSAVTAEDALVILTKHPEISVVFTDIRLPGMSGTELAQEVRKHRPDVKIVLTSAYMEVTPIRGTRFVPKPWSTTDFKLVAGMVARH